MRTIARGLVSLLDKPVKPVGVIFDLFVGALLGAPGDPTAPTHTVQARKGGPRPGDRDDQHSPASGPNLSDRVSERKAPGSR